MISRPYKAYATANCPPGTHLILATNKCEDNCAGTGAGVILCRIMDALGQLLMAIFGAGSFGIGGGLGTR